MGRFPSPKYFFKTYTKNLTNPHVHISCSSEENKLHKKRQPGNYAELSLFIMLLLYGLIYQTNILIGLLYKTKGMIFGLVYCPFYILDCFTEP